MRVAIMAKAIEGRGPKATCRVADRFCTHPARWGSYTLLIRILHARRYWEDLLRLFAPRSTKLAGGGEHRITGIGDEVNTVYCGARLMQCAENYKPALCLCGAVIGG